MSLDKPPIFVGALIGIILGLIISYLLLVYVISEIGSIIQVQITIAINETAIIEAQKQMRGIP